MTEKAGKVIDTGTGYETNNVDELIGRHFLIKFYPLQKNLILVERVKYAQKKSKQGY